MEHSSEYWCLPLNPRKCEASFFSVDPHQANLQPNLLLFGSRLRFNPTPTFFGVTFDRTLFFSKHVSSLKAKFFPRLKALRCISASSRGPSKESLSLLYKSFLLSLLTYASPGCFPFLSATNFTKLEPLHRATSRAITSCLSSSPIPLLLSEASLLPLRVTLTHFTLLSCERALRLSTSFPVSGLARLGVKTRLCRSSWRAFAYTHPFMFSSTSSRKASLAFPPFSPWNLPSFTVESILSSSCFRSNPPLSRQGAALAHLDFLPLHNLVLWTGGFVFFSFLAKAAPTYLLTAFSVALRPHFFFQQAQFAPVFPLKSAPFYTLFAGLGSTIKSPLLLSFYLTLVLSLPLCPLLHLSSYLKLCGRSGWNCYLSPPVMLGCNGSPDTRISRETTRLMSWPDGERYLCPLQFLCSLSPLMSRIHSSDFSNLRRTTSSKLFDTQIPLIFTKCAPSSCSLCFLSSTL